MRFLVMVKASAESEAGQLPAGDEIGEMQAYNEELVKNGVMLAGEGLHASSEGARIDYSGTNRTVTRGPFPDPETLVAGYWVIQATSLKDAIEWLDRAPFRDGQVEIRPIFEAEDFGEALTPEQRDKEEQLRAQLEQQNR